MNNSFPDKFSLIAKVEGGETRWISRFPLPWTVGTPEEGITGEPAGGFGCATPERMQDDQISLKDAIMICSRPKHSLKGVQ